MAINLQEASTIPNWLDKKRKFSCHVIIIKTKCTEQRKNIKSCKVNQGSEFIVVIPKQVIKNGEEFLMKKNEEVRYSRANIEFSDI